jgi:excinuclease ABC subunit C
LRRGKRQTRSALNDIPGVGALTAQKLLREFGSIANLRRADIDSLRKIVSRKTAAEILSRLNAGSQGATRATGEPEAATGTARDGE